MVLVTACFSMDDVPLALVADMAAARDFAATVTYDSCVAALFDVYKFPPSKLHCLRFVPFDECGLPGRAARWPFGGDVITGTPGGQSGGGK